MKVDAAADLRSGELTRWEIITVPEIKAVGLAFDASASLIRGSVG